MLQFEGFARARRRAACDLFAGPPFLKTTCQEDRLWHFHEFRSFATLPEHEPPVLEDLRNGFLRQNLRRALGVNVPTNSGMTGNRGGRPP